MNPMNRVRFLVITILLTADFAVAAEIQVQAKVPLGDVAHNEKGSAISELLYLPKALTRAMATAGSEGRIYLREFPVAPGQRQEVILKPFKIYAQGARITVLENGREPYEIPRSNHRGFLGASMDGSMKVGLNFDPQSGTLRGLAMGDHGTFEIVADDPLDPLRLEVRDGKMLDNLLETTCGSDELPLSLEIMERAAGIPPSLAGETGLVSKVATGNTFVATIAVDTDNEFHHLRFGNDTTAASNWLALLFTAMNVYYNRDVDLELVLGDTFFRLDTDPSPTYDDDPYSNTDSPASSAALFEFRSFWSSNMGTVDRVFSMLLSGKSSSNNSSSGIAFVDGYCEPSSGGYSVSQVFKFTPSLVTSGVRLIAHELGHNLGSPHTHCYNPPVDNCYALEGGCYSGAVSCPAAGRGTVMSYCHFSSGANCGSSFDEFHPTVVSLFDDLLNAHFPGCIESGEGKIFADGFESGNTSMWN